MNLSWLSMFVSLLISLPLAAQVVIPAPVREYAFTNGLTDAAGGPALQALGGTVTGGAYVFGVNQGLLLTDSTLSATTYTYELLFKFDSIGSYQRILDFKNRTTDTGLYSHGSNLVYYTMATATEADFFAGQSLQVVITRDGGTGLVSTYVNGMSRFSFTDSSNLAVFSGLNGERYFFTDDLVVGGEAAAGSVDLIRIFDQSFSSGQVLELFQNGAPVAVPEPSVLGLLGTGLLVLGIRHRRLSLRSKRSSS